MPMDVLSTYFAPDGGSGGVGDNDDDNTGDDNTNDDDLEIEKLKEEVKKLEKEHKKELDRYRNDNGKLKKQLKELEEKGMSEEEKLQAREKELLEKEQVLRVKELEAFKAQKVAELGLDKRLGEGIKIDQMYLANEAMSEEDIEKTIQDLKTVQDAIAEEVVNDLQQKGTILNGFGGQKTNQNNGGSFGQKLAGFDKENNKGASEAQENYFGKSI